MTKKTIGDRRRILLRAAKTFAQSSYTISGGKKARAPVTLPAVKCLGDDLADLDVTPPADN